MLLPKVKKNRRSTSFDSFYSCQTITIDTKRIDKNLYTNNPEGIPISLISTHDPITQAEFVAAEIKKALIYSKGLIQYKDIAVLMRMNAFSQNLEQIFRLNKIPFTMVSSFLIQTSKRLEEMTEHSLQFLGWRCAFL